MDIFDNNNLQGPDIEVFEDEAPEQAILPASTTPVRRKLGKLKTSLTALAVLLCFSAALIGAGRFFEPKINAYSLMINGKSAGVFTSQEEAASVVSDYKEELGEYYNSDIDFSDNVEIAQVSAYGNECVTAASAGEIARSMLTPVTTACGIYIDGMFSVAVATEEDAQLLLDAIKDYYAQGKENVVSVDFAETVELKTEELNPVKVVATDEAYDFLLNYEYDPPVYSAEQDGESLYDLAIYFDISVEELHKLNPDLQSDVLYKGDKICLAQAQKPLTVILTRTETAKAVIPYETQKIDNPDEYRGLEKTIQEGSDGVSVITYSIVEQNDEQVEKEIQSEDVIVAAQDYIIERGTKNVVATRYFNRNLGDEKVEIEQTFIWPLTGIITDSFASDRSTGVHTGLDIAVDSGTEVKAMADGVVVLSEYSGSYGNLIKIDHGDGVETWYAHLSSRDVKLGDVVCQGDVIGLSGNTGRSTGPHLHVEVRIDTVAYNALDYLP